MKHGLNLNKDNLKHMQNSDPTLFKIITKMETDNSVCLNNYVLENGILYKTFQVLGQTVFRLSLPNYLGLEVLQKHQNYITVGKQWQTDIAHMPRSKAGYKYILVFAERITHYICSFALKNITALTVSNALRIILSIIPPFDQLGSDFGGEYS